MARFDTSGLDALMEDMRKMGEASGAMAEAMTNAARHAGAQQVTIAVTETVETLTAVFTNDGAAPSRPVSETGGLRNLRSRLESAGGDMTVCSAPRFSLTVSIPKGGRDHAL